MKIYKKSNMLSIWFPKSTRIYENILKLKEMHETISKSTKIYEMQ